jgi:hypothetical protein
MTVGRLSVKSSTTARDYLTRFQTGFLQVHDNLDPSDREDWMSQFRRQSSDLSLNLGIPAGLGSRREVEQTLSPENPAAHDWAEERMATGWLPLPDPEDPFAALALL